MQENLSVNRRSFLKGALALTAGAALPAALLAGCSSQSSGAQSGKTPSAPMDEAARAAAITNPAYMGSAKNYAGQDVVIGVGAQGQIANQKMIDHHIAFEPHLEKVTDRIYSAVGNALSNSTIIIGDTGIIVIDTGDCIETAELDLELFRTVTDLPVKALIYTHSHYVSGAQAYIPADNPDNIPIIAQERLMEALTSPLTETSTVFVDRGFTTLGSYLPFEGEDGSVGGGVGAFFTNPYIENPTSGFIPPTTLIPVSDEWTVMNIDGLTLHFNPTFADEFANINIYVEEENTVITNQIACAFWNMYTLRGEVYRDPVNNLVCIDRLIDLNPQNLVPVHGIPLLGNKLAVAEMKRYRDGIQFIYDQTIRFMNKGYAPDDIVNAVAMPTVLIEGPYNQPFYGEVEHHVRGVYRGIIGWFGNDPLELHPVKKSFASGKIVEAMGGAKAVIDEANRVLEDGQYAWAATLATYVLDTDPESADAKQAKAQAFRKMGQVTEATNTRHWYMTKALELEGSLDTSIAASYVTKDKLTAAPRTLVLDMLRVSIDPEKAKGVEESLVITYTNENASNSMTIRNCIGQVTEGSIESPSIELQLDYGTMLEIVTKEKTLSSCLESGEATLIGDEGTFKALFEIFEMKL